MPTFTKTFINPVVALKEFPLIGKTRTTPEQDKLWFNYQRKNYDLQVLNTVPCVNSNLQVLNLQWLQGHADEDPYFKRQL